MQADAPLASKLPRPAVHQPVSGWLGGCGDNSSVGSPRLRLGDLNHAGSLHARLAVLLQVFLKQGTASQGMLQRQMRWDSGCADRQCSSTRQQRHIVRALIRRPTGGRSDQRDNETQSRPVHTGRTCQASSQFCIQAAGSAKPCCRTISTTLRWVPQASALAPQQGHSCLLQATVDRPWPGRYGI